MLARAVQTQQGLCLNANTSQLVAGLHVWPIRAVLRLGFLPLLLHGGRVNRGQVQWHQGWWQGKELEDAAQELSSPFSTRQS